jgi:hypothetical protein
MRGDSMSEGYMNTQLKTNDYGILEGGDGDGGGAQVSGEVALWRAVITQSLQDAGSNSKKPEMRKAKAEAIAWLAGTCEDFEEVCENAHLGTDYVRKKSKEAIARGCVWREVNPNSFTKNRKQKKQDVVRFQSNIKGGVKMISTEDILEGNTVVNFEKKCV